MKTRKHLYIILGALAMFFYIGGIYMIFTVVKRVTPSDIQNANNNLITQQLWLVIALLFFRAAYRMQKKIDRQKKQALENAFDD
ncbi:hypothetical protein [Niastella sp. OAS944]|uniref:hypothetical protein n=1 Tax=Niastella sp. OAS944 TaxID=2664089 RepID=UPI003487EDCD|nr:NADH:ubiquinone oxidoreductase subunit 2 (subunit N) [Chitinophagaceae bacterium OAS944]